MLEAIRVQAARGDSERYKEVLRADWSDETLDDILSLLWKLIAKGARPKTFSWQRVLAYNIAKKSAREFEAGIIDRIQDLALVFTEPSIPAIPRHFTANRPS